MALGNAIATIQRTPAGRRAALATQARRQNPAGSIPTYEQYVRAVKMHRPGMHDAGGAVIHATPPAVRSEYAQRIAAFVAPKRRETAAARAARWE